MKIIGANITGSFILNSQDVTTTIQTSNVWSGSVATDITALNAATASLLNYTASNNAAISDILLETASINTFTSSVDSRVSVIEGKYITTGSNTFVGTQYVSNTTQATTFTSTASLYTDGGLRVGKDSYVSGSMFVKGNLTVFGTSSIEYVTSSVFVGLEYIDLNTDLPALRYAGIRVYDSGSNVGVTGSLFWDSQTNHWIYSNPSGSSYSGGMLISGPRASSLGSEEGTTNNALMKGQGGDHITSSQIIDDGTTVRIPGNLQVTGSTIVTSNLRTDTGLGLKYGSFTSTSGYLNLFSAIIGSTATLSLKDGTGGYESALNFPVSANRSYTFPNADGTVALTSNLSAYLPLSGGTTSGTITADFNNSWGFRMNRTANTNYIGVVYATGGTNNWYIGPREDGTNTYRIYNFQTTVNAFSIDINGNCTANGDVTAYSDKRIKENILPINNALNKVLTLTGVTYNRIDLEDKSTKIGFIAQEVEKVLPEVVLYDEKVDRYAVSYGNVTALLVEAIKEQQSQIEELKTIINGLTK